MEKRLLYAFVLIGMLFGVGLTHTETAYALICTNTLTSGTSIPTGYGASYNPLTSTREYLVSVACGSGTTGTVTAGNGNPLTYVYNRGYYWTGSTWTAYTLSCASGALISGAWCPGRATASIPLPQNPTNVIAYTCQYTNSTWKCGCRDATCSTAYWQLQRVGVTQGTSGARDHLLEPFSSASIWNTAIGSSARFVPVTISTSWDQSWGKIPGSDTNFIALTPTAPATNVYYSSAGWTGADRCAPTNTTILGTVPMPTSFVVPHGRGNNSSAFLLSDGRTLKQFQPFTRCTAGGPATSLVGGSASVDIYGDGIRGTHGGSGMSSLGGTIRVGELRPGQQGPPHALSLTTYMKEAYRCTTQADCFRWPAVKADTYALQNYGSMPNNPNIANTAYKMGALFAIPGSISISSLNLETEPGRQLAWTLQNYGGYVVDDAAGASFYFTTEYGPAGNFLSQFRQDWGFDFEQTQSSIDSNATAWVRDIRKILSALHIVDNNTATSIGGGGTPRVPRKPEIAP